MLTGKPDRDMKKQVLLDRVELAIKDHYKTKKETQERMKCSVCGKGYLGQKNSSTCSDKCRKKKSRGK